MRKILSLLLIFPISIWSMLIGNPGQPSLQTEGIIADSDSWWSFRTAFIEDYVYSERFREEYKIQNSPHTQTYMKLSTYAGLLTINFKNALDLYGIIGSSRMQIDDEIFTKRRLGWGVGAKWMIFSMHDFHLGIDVKYFETTQVPTFFIADKLPYNVVSEFHLEYHEIQTAVGISYTAWIFSPYIDVTYLAAKIEPKPAITLVRFPDENVVVDAESKSSVNQKRWGMALGLSLVDKATASLAVEWRLFNQNAIDVNLEVRF